MASSKIKGITIELGGDTTKLDKALSNSEKQSKNLQGELKGINTLLKFDPSSIELITQKQQVLSEAIEATKGKLKTLEQAQVQVQAQFEKGEITAEQYRSFQREIVSTQKKLKDLENQQSQLNGALNQAESAYSSLTTKISNQESELTSLKKEYTNIVLEYGDTSDEAQNLAKKITDLSGELNENKTRLNNAEKAAEDLSQSLKEANDSAKDTDGYTVAKDVLADFASNAIQGVIDGIGNVISALGELPEATKEYRTMMAKLEGSTKTFGYSADFSKEQFDNFYSYLGDNQMSTNAITNLMGIGTSTESISKIAEGAIGVWATYGDSIPIESLTEAINETITVGKVTGTMADTINWAKVSQDELGEALSGNSEAQKAFNQAIADGEAVEDAFNAALATTTDTQERADIIAQFLNSTYGESKKTYDEMTGSIQNAQTAENNLQETQAQLAEAVEPMQTAFTNLKTQALELLLPIVEKISGLFQDLGKWMEENPAKAELLKGALIGIATALGILAGALAISNLISLVQKAFALLNVTMLANPIVLIVAAIAGLVAAFIYLWNNCESFREFWINLWEKIKSIVSGAIDFIVEWFNKIVNFVKENWQGLLLLIVNPFAGAFKLLYDNCEGFRNFVDKWIKKIKDFFVNGFNSIKEKVVSIFSNLKNGVVNIATNIKDGIVNRITNLKNGVVNTFNSIKDTATSIFNKVKNAITNPIETAKNVVKGIVDKIKGFFNFKVSLPKIKLPHFSIKPNGWELGDLLKGSIPKLGIEWYAKGAILKKPTIFGVNGDNAMVGGEAGAEAIAPISELLKYVKLGVDESLRGALFDALTSFTNTKVQTRNTTIYGINELTNLLKSYMPEIIANMDKDLILDGKKVGQTIAPEVNRQLGYIAQANLRGR